MSERRIIRVFISSPSDVRPERLIARRVVERLAREFSYHASIEAVLWEREPLLASQHFQDKIVPPGETDITVVILWSRLGLPLPEDKYIGSVSGRKPVTGTEWEFEDALKSYRDRQLPDLLLYRKTVEVTGSLENEEALKEQLSQKHQVEDFMARWTRSADGRAFTAASWPFDSTAAFEELLEDHLRELIRRRLTTSDTIPVSLRWYAGSPFRGLQSFEVEHSSIFFGRTRARNEVRELLSRQEARGSAFVLVVGASGSGKSSLVKAGVLPDLTLPGMVGKVALCRYGIMRPGDCEDLAMTLASTLLQPSALPELSTLQYDARSLADLLRGATGQSTLPIRQGLAAAARSASLVEGAEARLLIIIDQLEELFTRDSLEDADRKSFVAALETLAKSGLVWVIATMRSDFFDRLEKLPRLLSLTSGEARYVLAPPDPAEIAQMIRQPAREAGIRFEADAARGLSLDEEILKAAAQNPGALPLLSFLLDQLWQARDEHGILTFASYEKLGGLEGSLGRRADQVYAALPVTVQAALPELLRALVTVGPGSVGARHVATARSASLSHFPPGTARCELLDALLDPKARLLVAEADEKRGAQVRVAHEALLSHWEVARKQVEDDARDLQLRARLEQASQLWRDTPPRHKLSVLLPGGFPLAEARDLIRRWQDIDSEILEFVTESRRAWRNRKLRLAGLTLGAVLSVPLAAGLIWLALVWKGVHDVERDLLMARIPKGCFAMGSPEDEPGRGPDESPLHQVCVPTFELGKFEVTQEQWRAVMLTNPSQYQGHNMPVENVSWEDIEQFIGRLNRFGSRYYRLPTEAEWEYAARARATTAYFWGPTLEPDGCKYANINDQSFREAAPLDPISPQAASCNDGFYHPAPVGSFLPNDFGLFDIHGNVWEWVQDDYHPNYVGAPTDGSGWISGKPRVQHVLRGGSWHTVPRRARAAQREKELSDYRIGYIGFRLAASVRP
jgi:formylglycine-generating enzyme required for sulfatase activity